MKKLKDMDIKQLKAHILRLEKKDKKPWPKPHREALRELFNRYKNPNPRCSYPFTPDPVGYCCSYACHVDGDPKFKDLEAICKGCEEFNPKKGKKSCQKLSSTNASGASFPVYYHKDPKCPKNEERYICNIGAKKKPEYWSSWISYGNEKRGRTDPLVIQVVKKLGEKANGEHAELAIVEIPRGVEWEIDEYDGVETVEEKHRSWS